jgi:FtsZ-interacting cell division protein ZipA
VFCLRTDEGALLYTMSNLDPVPLTPENIRTIGVRGVTLLLDVPKTAHTVRVFDQMLSLARQWATSLGGVVVDDYRRPLTDEGAEGIRKLLRDLYGKMEAAQVPAGSDKALRLFS